MKALHARPGAQSRPIFVPAPPAVHAEDMAEGADVLLEHPGPLGIPLWGALRDFMLWVQAPMGERAALFGSGAGEARRAMLAAVRDEPELWTPLLTLAQMTDAPERADHARLVHAVRSVARWAERKGTPATRLAFTTAAALALPDQSTAALEAARQARDLARHAQAETWFRCAIRLARGRDWESYAWGFIGLGVLYRRAGNQPAARAVISRALRAAHKRRLRGIAGTAHHHLFVFTSDTGRMDEAYYHANAAIRAYGPAHPRLPVLAHDLGVLWVNRGEFERAIPVLEATLPLLGESAERVVVLANVARASAAVGNRARYQQARAEVGAAIEKPAFGSVAAEALLIVAHGDASLGQWALAEATARRAAELADARGEAMVRTLAEAQVDAARAENKLGSLDAAVGRPPRAPEAHPEQLEARADTLALEVRAALVRYAGCAAGA
ncbi:MAG TPA: tetratricopeptide repeat protein [Longimicrobium sp.]|nr:tetratricopeptide repeat protein [Longimicrobium sp.]